MKQYRRAKRAHGQHGAGWAQGTEFGLKGSSSQEAGRWERRFRSWRSLRSLVFGMLCASLLLSGCSRLRPKPLRHYVYVTAKEQFLRDRMAAVSNRTATVENGERLEVLDRGRSHLKVQTDKGAIGWIDEKFVATQEVYDEFQALATEDAKTPPVATGVVRDEVYLHLTPGRSTEKFYRLAEGEKLSLIKRATLPKVSALKAGPLRNPKQAAIPGAATGIPAPKPAEKQAAAAAPAGPFAAPKGAATTAKAEPAPASATAEDIPPPVMEDWWLVRDSKGEVGWMLSRMMDVDAPDTLSRYSEGQRIVGAYVLATVHDPDAPGDIKDVPEYVAVLSPYKAGLPYDFDQVRVFIWNARMHRYETGFRERNMEGYLPVRIKMMQDLGSKAANASVPLPAFTYKVLSGSAGPVIPDPVSGEIVPGPTIAKTYRLEGNILRRMEPPGTEPVDEAHPMIVTDKKEGKKAGRRRR